ncbi:MAG TPA: hypothetical protein PKK20_00895 [Verrucomicrobiota bacterium]|nr:hypothetical protein [Verrucomicrobiota bacterium]OQC62346.1 MAG: hypothetical protein BWX48_03722 [Verrucomicrobia bacterium ADurb.Bin006]HNU98479.1 hypothetical protein [Verrucomicrobiota bacterium]HOA61667.1 hypothetical protein [Verrucomicrobiota bacterium]HOG87272.1 hypothetical protein [Verrucomicrobiota bacterium]
MAWVHPEQFRRCVVRYRADYKVLTSRRSSRQTTLSPLAVVVLAIKFTIVWLAFPHWLQFPDRV